MNQVLQIGTTRRWRLQYSGHSFYLLVFRNVLNSAVQKAILTPIVAGTRYFIADIADTNGYGAAVPANAEVDLVYSGNWEVDVYGQSGIVNLAPENATYLGQFQLTVTGQTATTPSPTLPQILTCADVKECIGISTTGDEEKFLNEKGEWITIEAAATSINGLISAGSNVTITGSGTQEAPYVISSTASGGESFDPTTSVVGTITPNNSAIATGDTVQSGFSKAQGQINALSAGKQNALGYTPENAANKGAANGYTPLNASSKIDTTYLPDAVLGQLAYQGVWNASTNNPSLASGVGTKGYYYIVSVSGATNLDGITDWVVGDWAVYNGTAWNKIDNTDAISSFNGRIGAITLISADVAAALGFTPVSAETFTSLTFGSTVTWDNQNKQLPLAKLTVTGNFTLGLTNVKSGCAATLIVTMNTASAVIMTLPASFTDYRKGTGTTIGSIALPANNGARYFVYYECDATTLYWTVNDGTGILASGDVNIDAGGTSTIQPNVVTYNMINSGSRQSMLVTDSTVQTALNTESGWSGDTKTGISNLLAGQLWEGTNLTDGLKYRYSCQVAGTATRNPIGKAVAISSLPVTNPTRSTGATDTTQATDTVLVVTAAVTIALSNFQNGEVKEIINDISAGGTVTLSGTVSGVVNPTLNARYKYMRIRLVGSTFYNVGSN
jgi:hypothetical protein